MLSPYVGITGFMNSHDEQACLDMVPAKSRHGLMAGMLISSKTLRGIPNKYPGRYPPLLEFNSIFVDHPKAFNVVHYNTDEPDTLPEQLRDVTKHVRSNLHGFQLNMKWPAPEVLKKLSPYSMYILQVGPLAFEAIQNSPEKLAAKVAQYEGFIDYVLLDPSAGTGRVLGEDPDFTVEKMREYLQALYALGLPDVGFGIAGGLSHRALHLVEPLFREFQNLSADAESRLRDADDRLNLALAGKYLSKFFGMSG